MKREHPLDTAARCVGYLEQMESDKARSPEQRREARSVLHDLRKAILCSKRLKENITKAQGLMEGAELPAPPQFDEADHPQGAKNCE